MSGQYATTLRYGRSILWADRAARRCLRSLKYINSDFVESKFSSPVTENYPTTSYTLELMCKTIFERFGHTYVDVATFFPLRLFLFIVEVG